MFLCFTDPIFAQGKDSAQNDNSITNTLHVQRISPLNNTGNKVTELFTSFDKSISVLSLVFSIFGVCLMILTIIFALFGFLGFREYAKLKELRNKLSDDAKVVGTIIKKIEEDRDILSSEIQNIDAPIKDAASEEIKQKADELNDRLKLLEMFGNSLTAKDYKNRAADLYYKKKLQLALHAIEKATELDSNYYDAWHQKGFILDEMEKYSEAVNAYKKAIEVKQDAANSFSAMGVTYTKLKKYEDAIDAYNKALKIDPSFKIVWINIGYTLGLQEKYEEALSAYDKAVQLNIDHPYAWNNKGYILSKLKRYDEAITHFEMAIRILPGYPRAHYNLARVYSLTDNKYDALAYLKMATNYDFLLKREAQTDNDFINLRNDDDFRKTCEF